MNEKSTNRGGKIEQKNKNSRKEKIKVNWVINKRRKLRRANEISPPLLFPLKKILNFLFYFVRREPKSPCSAANCFASNSLEKLNEIFNKLGCVKWACSGDLNFGREMAILIVEKPSIGSTACFNNVLITASYV